MESGTETINYSTLGANSNLTPEAEKQQRKVLISVGIAAAVMLILLVAFIIYLLTPGAPTERIRDVFIIVMALETLVLGLALVILIIQLARLINLLQNEIKPILESTNETISTLRGTTTFLSDNLAEPVIKLNEYLAALSQMFRLVGLGGKGRKKTNDTQGV